MPAQIPPMSPESEQALVKTSERIADYTAQGMEPNEAIAKAAGENQVPAGHIHLLVNAYNASRTTTQRQLGSDVWDKSAAFPVASEPTILDLMYPGKPKTAEQTISETWLSDDYQASPVALNRQLKAACDKANMMAKGYSDKPPEAKPKPKPAMFEPALKVEKGKVEAATKEANEARMRWESGEALVAESVDALAHSFYETDARAFSDVKEGCSRLLGLKAAALFSYLEKSRPDLTKLGTANRFAAARGPSYDLVAQCLDALELSDKLAADYEMKQANQANAQRDYRHFLGVKEPPVPHNAVFGWEEKEEVKTAVEAPVPLFAWDEPKEAAETKAPFFTGAMSTLTSAFSPMKQYGEELGKKRVQHMVDSEFKRPEPDLQLDDEMKQIHQRNVVQDLLSSDDVVSGYDPHHVLNAYKEIADVAPLAAQRLAIAKDFTRRRLAGGQLSYFDLNALLDMEKNLTDMQRKPVIKPDKD